MLSELDILRDVARKFEKAKIDYMLTGSFAMNYYAMPRMTRDIDIVLLLPPAIAKELVITFSRDYYISENAVSEAIRRNSMFNIIHTDGAIKVDLILRKNDEYAVKAFSRKKRLTITDFDVNIISREDLIISKLMWSKESLSEQQFKDISNLVGGECDQKYLNHWLEKLSLSEHFKKAVRHD